MVTTTNCCYCASLRTGTLIIGWLHEVYFMITLALNITVRASGQTSDTTSGSWSMIILAALQMIVAIGLLYGVYTHHKQSVYWFVMVESFLIVVNIIAVIVAIVSAGLEFSAVLSVVVFAVVVFFIQIYLVVVVYSFYKEM